MGEKDITEKILEDYNDVFADIINGLLFQGEQRVLPEALENISVHSQYKADDEKMHELERDVAKYWKEKEVQLAVCGIENQSRIEKNMPFRIIGYDGAAYRSQLQQERSKILPVVTIVLYFGTDRHWRSGKNIKSLMEIPTGLDEFVSDYQIKVFEIAWLSEEQISYFQSDFRIVANFFVNKRYVKSRACAAALEEAYRNLLMTGKFPACVLYIDIPPNTIDVNVHPTKIEVRFSDEKLMHEAVFFAVKNSLMKNDRPNEMHLENKRNFTDRELFDIPKKDNSVQLKFSMENDTPKPAVQKTETPAPIPQTDKVYENSYSYQKPAPTLKTVESRSITPEEKEKLSGSDDMFLASLEQPAKRETAVTELSGPEPKPHKVTVEEINKAISEMPLPEEPEEQSGEAFKFIDAQSFTKKKPVSVIVEEKEPEKPKPVVVGELFKTYVVAQVGDEMILMDKHAAHERYIFERIKSDAEQLETQMFLEPIMVLLSYDEYDALTANLDKVSQLGFEIEPDVAPTVAVKGVPIILGDDNPADIISELAKNFIENKLNPQIELFDDLYHSIACKAAIKANDTNSGIELQALVNAVYGQENIRYCPHGRPVMITLTKRDIEKQFRRVL